MFKFWPCLSDPLCDGKECPCRAAYMQKQKLDKRKPPEDWNLDDWRRAYKNYESQTNYYKK